MASKLRRELPDHVDLERGRYGEFKVKVDGRTVVDAGALAFLGILPSWKKVVAAVRSHLAQPAGA